MSERYTVTEIGNVIKDLITDEFGRKEIILTGEISSIKSSGNNTYFNVKDESSAIDVISWNNNLTNEKGDEVEMKGSIAYYNKTNRINFNCKAIKNNGVGVVHIEYEKRKKKFNDLGYFDNSKPLPNSITNVGVVTSRDAAAIQDFLYVMKKRGFIGNIYIYNCLVQGDRCHQSISAGIKYFNKPFTVNQIDSDESIDSDKSYDSDDATIEEVDIIVITRGGGSFEDLMGFSHEMVVEAIHNSNKYTISAVGHEVDNMLSDYTANYRAPTPSIAGETLCDIYLNKKNRYIELIKRMQYIKQDILSKLKNFKDSVSNLAKDINDPNQLVKQRQEKISEIIKSQQYIKKDILFKLNSYKDRLIYLKNKLIDPYDLLKAKIDLLIKEKEKIRSCIHDDINKLKVKIDYIQSSLETAVGTEKSKVFLEQGFILFIDAKGYIVHDIDNLFNTNLKMIHNSGTYDVIIKKSSKSSSVDTNC